MQRPNLKTCSRKEATAYIEWLESLLTLDEPPSENEVGPWVHRVNSDTSRMAAYEIVPESGSQRLSVLQAIWNAGKKGRTRDELSVELHLPSNSICPRVWELKMGGWVQENNEALRVTRAGRFAHPVILTPAGKYTCSNYSVLRRSNGHEPMKIHSVPE